MLENLVANAMAKELTREQKITVLKKCKKEPVKFIENALGIKLDERQANVIKSFYHKMLEDVKKEST